MRRETRRLAASGRQWPRSLAIRPASESALGGPTFGRVTVRAGWHGRSRARAGEGGGLAVAGRAPGHLLLARPGRGGMAGPRPGPVRAAASVILPMHMCMYLKHIQHTYGLICVFVCEAHTADICTIICTRYKAIHISYARTVLDTYDISACICMYLYVSPFT